MKISSLFCIFLTCLIFIDSKPVKADDYLVCESKNDRRSYCNVYNSYSSSIRISRVYSSSPCIEGSTWGRDDRGVWVDRGCRAEFAIRRGRDGYQGGIRGPNDNNRYDGDYDRDNRYDSDRRREWEKQQELQREIDRAKELNEQLKQQQSAKPAVESCPAGFEPGNHRCTDAERRKGCKDMRMPGGTTCSSRGWGYR